METLIGLLILLSFIALIVGLIKPVKILFWDKKPTRIKVFLYWIVAIVSLSIFSSFFDVSESEKTSTSEKIESSKDLMINGDYSSAITILRGVNDEDSLYNTAQSLIKEADSLNQLGEEEKALAIQAANKVKALEEIEAQKNQLQTEIDAIDKKIDFSKYRGTVEALQLELVLFNTWGKMIKEGESSEDEELKGLSKKLKSKVSSIQVSEFPKLRLEYGKIVAKKLWVNDIDVYTNGTGSRYINFTGGAFAANQNKQDFQVGISEVLNMFRFNQSRYRWYDGADEYTYYTMFESKDSDLVTFK